MDTAIRENMEAVRGQPLHFLVGFDGFVDTIVRPVKSTEETGNRYFSTIEEFGRFLVSKAGKSCSVLLETKQRRLGGNAPIFARSAALLGQSVTCIGALGNAGLDPVFAALADCCSVITVAEPGQSTALEFDDGKIMLAQNADIDLLDYDRVAQRVGKQQIACSINKADLIALLNWSELERATQLWQGLLDNCMDEIPLGSGKKMLVDLCDCSHKTPKQIDEMLGLLRGFAKHFTLLLTLNENEAELIGQHLALGTLPPTELAQAIRCGTGIQMAVIHAIGYACGASETGVAYVQSTPIQKPVSSTGAGDHFNSGLALAWAHGFGLSDMLTVANNVTCLYLSTGVTATLDDLILQMNGGKARP